MARRAAVLQRPDRGVGGGGALGRRRVLVLAPVGDDGVGRPGAAREDGGCGGGRGHLRARVRGCPSPPRPCSPPTAPAASSPTRSTPTAARSGRRACARATWRVSAGHGTVYATTTARPRDGEPYDVSLIDLDEGFRMMSRVAGGGRIGQRVRVAWEASARLLHRRPTTASRSA